MNFPNWAPKRLIDFYLFKTDDTRPKFVSSTTSSTLTEKQKEAAIKAIDSQLLFLPDDEGIDLLKKYISDERMRIVWTSLEKRIDDDVCYIRFFHKSCQGITGWRRNSKLTSVERKNNFTDIHKTAEKLLSLLNLNDEFSFYSTTNLISDSSTKWLLEDLDSNILSEGDFEGYHELTGDKLKEQLSYARFLLSEVVPSTDEILMDISSKSLELTKTPPIVKQPNSPNAHIHFFIRFFSNYMRREYGQPLHKIVAITTSVVFDLDDYDEDKVRKIVSN